MLYEAAHFILTKPVKGGRPPDLRPGWRNAVQPDKETARSLRRKRRSTRRFSGRIGTFLPEGASLPGRWIGSGREKMQEELGLKPGDPARLRLDRPFPLRTPSGGSPALSPYRSMPPGRERRKKGIDYEGPLQRRFSLERFDDLRLQSYGIECVFQLLAHCVIAN